MTQRKIIWHGLSISIYGSPDDYIVDLNECLKELNFTRIEIELVYDLFYKDKSKIDTLNLIPLKEFTNILISLAEIPRNIPFMYWTKGEIVDDLIQKALIDCFEARTTKSC